MRNRILQSRCASCSMTIAASCVLLIVSGCASEPAKPVPTVTPDQVRSNAEKGFERLKQEEENRPAHPSGNY